MTWFVRLGVALVVVLGTVAMAGGAGSASDDDRPDLPPSERAALARVFDAKLKPLGLRTTRAALQSLTSYRADDEGRHLAIYVEPTGAITDEEYATNFTKVARIFLPLVFDRWSALKSFDVCQEPPPTSNNDEEPPPVTQLQVTRRGAAGIRWSRVTLEQLVVRAEAAGRDRTAGSRQRLFVYLEPSLNDVPIVAAARAAAAAAAATTTTTTP